MKIAVYSIAKNEEKFVERWAESTRAADYRFVLDTGSEDQTVQKLQMCGIAHKTQIITPWRFDVARNLSLAELPSDIDICISLDMDEILDEGWRLALEKDWKPRATMMRYPFVAELVAEPVAKPRAEWTPKIIGNGFKVHRRHAYRWNYALHEILVPLQGHIECHSDDFKILHLPDKSKPRDLYEQMLLRLTVEEAHEPRYFYYLGRLYFDQQKYQQALELLAQYHAFSETFVDTKEKAFAWRLVAWSYKYQNHGASHIVSAHLQSIAFNPYDREAWFHFAQDLKDFGDLIAAKAAALNACRLKDPKSSYILLDQDCWNGGPEKFLAELG